MKDRYRELVSNTIIFGLGIVASKLISFWLLPLYTNTLTSSQYGTADLVFTMSELVRPFISLAIFNGLLRYGLSTEYKKEDSFYCTTIIFLIGSVATIAITPLVGIYKILDPWKWYFCAYVITVFASKNTFIYLKVSNQNKTYALLSVLQAALIVACNIMMLLIWKKDVAGYLLANIMAPAIVAIIAFARGGMLDALRRAVYKNDLMKKMLLYSAPFIVNDISWWVIHSSDKIMLERMKGTTELGIYTAASKIPVMLSVIVSIFSEAWNLSAVREYESENNYSFYSTITKYFSIVLFGVCIALTAITKPFMRIYFGKSFLESWHYVPLLLLATSFSAMSSFVGSFFIALKNSKAIMWSTIAAGIINIIINFIFIRICGIWGAVIGTVVAYAINAVMRIIVMHKKIAFELHTRQICVLAGIAGIQALFVGLDFHVILVNIFTFGIYFAMSYKDIFWLTKKLLGVMSENRFIKRDK